MTILGDYFIVLDTIFQDTILFRTSVGDALSYDERRGDLRVDQVKLNNSCIKVILRHFHRHCLEQPTVILCWRGLRSLEL
jgi:hypothetical protein